MGGAGGQALADLAPLGNENKVPVARPKQLRTQSTSQQDSKMGGPVRELHEIYTWHIQHVSLFAYAYIALIRLPV